MKTHWFPFIRPAIKPLFLGGVRDPGGGRLTSHDFYTQLNTQLGSGYTGLPSVMVYLATLAKNNNEVYEEIVGIYIYI